MEKFGVERIGFLTLTFSDNVQTMAVAQKRFNSLATGALKRYEQWICCVERSKNGRVHFHLLVVCQGNIRGSVDFARVRGGDYTTANKALRGEWAFWRLTAPKYSFGRTELMPIKSSGGAAEYIGKYIAKHINHRRPEDAGAKLVRYSKGAGAWSSTFTWVSPGTFLWRAKLKQLACALGLKEGVAYRIVGHGPLGGVKLENCGLLMKAFGPRWGYRLRVIMGTLKLPVYRNGREFNMDNPSTAPEHDRAEQITCSSIDAIENLYAASKVVVNQGKRLWADQAGALWLNALSRLGVRNATLTGIVGTAQA